MPSIAGKYQHYKNEDIDDYFTAVGVPYIGRKLMSMSSPLMEIKLEGDTMAIKNSSLVRTVEYTFKLGEEYVENMPNNSIKVLTYYFSVAVLEHTQFGADRVLDFTSNVLNGGVQGCALRVACWSGQRGHEEGTRFWTGVMSNHLMSTLVNSTAVEDAMASGRRGRDCSVYSPCPLTAEHYPVLMRNLIQLSNANG